MKRIYTAQNEAELAVFRSILDAEDVPHFVHNESFGSILVGPQIDNYNSKSIMVPDELENRALELVSRFKADTAKEISTTSFRDRVRMIFETFFFSWFVPGRSKRSSKGGRDSA